MKLKNRYKQRKTNSGKKIEINSKLSNQRHLWSAANET